ncbi:PREDICTED: complement component C1q receptor-like [Branchiostoma belcheri]|uniref:Complement component C1q receptor-like n=1 Tax=Branchiostoma belcheri TaxID=7741 RepID=A0A6P5A9K4_BRABE|nr:PREDICTED: complement component C1q receptor-like [Branchiostoma belcheri]
MNTPLVANNNSKSALLRPNMSVRSFGYSVALTTLCVFVVLTDASGMCNWASHNGHCFRLSASPNTYTEAKAACNSIGAHLAFSKDQATNDFLVSLMSGSATDAWIGLTDFQQENNFVWNDGSTLGTFRKWATGEPNDGPGSQADCVRILLGGQWKDYSCSGTFKFICETDTDVCLHDQCDAQATCTDNPPPALDATCTCNTGYTGDGLASGTGCSDTDACLANPCDAQATCTDNPPPALDATCTCNTGYTGDGLVSGTGCSDTDACLANPCDAQATCTDNPPPALDATCTCNTGYTGDGLVVGAGCSDIDACLANPCDAQATCTDNPPPALDATCTCNTGYTGDGLVSGTGCSDTDACLANPCDAQATCTDNPPPALGATCICNTGYTGDGLVSGTGCSGIPFM